jgi:RNA polymerase sigma-70 factor (ECF subfamily)
VDPATTGSGGRISGPSGGAGDSALPQPTHAAKPESPDLNLVEAAWIQKIAKGDRTAFERLFQAYERRLCGYLFRLAGQADMAEELASDVMLEVWKGAGAFRGQSKVSTWIFGIARFRAISAMRRTNPEMVDFDHAGPLSDGRELQDELLLKESTREEVRRAMEKITPHHREVIELTFYQGFSYPEIATILDCPLNTVKTRMFYARKELREMLEKGGNT